VDTQAQRCDAAVVSTAIQLSPQLAS